MKKIAYKQPESTADDTRPGWRRREFLGAHGSDMEIRTQEANK